jgi:hypothetical protein
VNEQYINDGVELFTEHAGGAFALNDTSEERGIRIARAISGTVLWPASTSAGELVIETAPIKGYTGKWAEAIKLTFAGGFVSAAQTGMAAVGANYARARWSVAPVDAATKPRVFLNWQV